MNLVLPLHRLEETVGPGWLHPLAVMPLANSTVLGQVLHSALQAGAASATLPTRAGEGEVAEWLLGAHPDLTPDLLVVQQTRDPLAAVRLTRSRWENSETLLISGDAVTDSDLSHLADEPFDSVAVIARPERPVLASYHYQDGRLHNAENSVEDGWMATGTIWFRDGRLLADALDSFHGAPAAATFLAHLLVTGHTVGAREARLHLPLYEPDGATVQPASLLAANGRLLSFGRSDSDAIERSYSEEFTVVPPVYIADSATVESSVIGSQTTIAAGAIVRNCVVSHSIIGPGAIVENAVLENALIGHDATVRGTPFSAAVPDHIYIDTDDTDKG